MSDKKKDASIQDSGAVPYLYDDYQQAVNTTMERSFYRTVPEIESQFKKPYLKGSHPQSEWEYSYPDAPFYPPIPGYPPGGGDCEVTGDAIGGGNPDPCEGGVSCGQWIFCCAHRIKSFSVPQDCGWVQSVKNQANDCVIVTACWDEDCKSQGQNVGPTAVLQNGQDFAAGNPADMSACCPKKDSGCTKCGSCTTLSIGYTSQQMGFSATQTLTATGGGGGYIWKITAGGGSLSATKGKTTVYTSPASNPNCASNPTIILTDCCGSTSSLQIAVTSTSTNQAIDVYTTSGTACAPRSASTCNCTRTGIIYHCDGTIHQSRTVEGGTCGVVLDCTQSYPPLVCAGTCSPVYGVDDLRTATDCTNGCCPSVALGGITCGAATC